MGNLGVFFGAQLGAKGFGPDILLKAQLGYDDLLDVDGDRLVLVSIGNTHVVGEPSDLLSVLLYLGLLFL